MQKKILKKIRLITAFILFIGISAIFIDFRQWITPPFVKVFLYLQLVPSLINFMHVFSITAGGFLFVVMLTLLFGRVYCSFICPLGILQDIFIFIAKKTKRIRVFRYAKAHTIIHYGFFALTLISVLAGSMLILSLLDPYSIFGRIQNDMVKPLVVVINNSIAPVLESKHIFWLYPIDLVPLNNVVFIISSISLLILVFLSLSHGRLYCNTVCPAGALLRMLSKRAWLRIRIDANGCTACYRCSMVCKAHCIDIKTNTVDFDRCVACYNCIEACPSYAIAYVPHKTSKRKETTDMEKRKFFTATMAYMAGLWFIADKLYAGLQKQKNAKTMQGYIRNEKTHPVSPPGSQSIKHFTSTCTACHLCVSACPTKVLQPAYLEYGLSGMMQPYMDFSAGFCNYDCTLCGEMCPTGAIKPLSVNAKHTTQTGIVHFVRNNCVVYTDNTSCGACSEHCPTKAVYMVPYKDGLTIPETDVSICIGCGACEYACPLSPPYKAIYVNGNAVHQKASRPIIEKMEQPAIHDDFPF